jgi:3'(2'), 5'-bisphosphate nucleotidase
MNDMKEIVIKAALEAGNKILNIYAQDFEVEFKADESPLTSADKAAHEVIEKALSSTGIPVLSEESREIPYAERADWGTFWLVDPLDGTKEFIKKNGEFTVNIALIKDGTPVLGVVYAPVLDWLYVGIGPGAEGMELGAWKTVDCKKKTYDEIIESAEALSIGNHQSEIGHLKIVASRSHCSEETVTFIEQLEAKYGAAERVSMGSSLKLCLVAEASADIYPRIAPTMEWDTGAAHAVVRSAGGEVYQYDPAVPAVAYLQGAESKEKNGTMPHALSPLRYNKENLLNPFFVVS